MKVVVSQFIGALAESGPSKLRDRNGYTRLERAVLAMIGFDERVQAKQHQKAPASWLAAGLAPRWRWSTQNRRPSTTQASPPTGGPYAGLISAPLLNVVTMLHEGYRSDIPRQYIQALKAGEKEAGPEGPGKVEC